MALTNTQKVYVCVLVLALGALLLDRLFFDSGAGPEEAVATLLVSPGSSSGDGANTPAALPTEDGQPESLAGRIEAMAEAQGLDISKVRDAFSLSGPWVAAVSKPEPPKPAEPDPRTVARDLRLMAVMVGGKGGYAIVNGQCLFVGQTLAGYKLISVGENSAVLESNGTRLELTLESVPEAGKSK